MQPVGYHPAARPPETEDPAARLAASAKGWHGIQMAVVGFIGICGVLWDGGSAPRWLQWLAAALAVAALVLAGAAIYLVGRVAYPVYTGTGTGTGRFGGAQEVEAAAQRLRRGIRTSFLAVVTIAVASLSGWWPGGGGTAGAASGTAASVEVRDEAGRRFCGELVRAPDGIVRVSTAEGTIALRVDGVTSIVPVDAC